MTAIATSLSPTCGREHTVWHREGIQNRRLTQVQAETRTSADITLVTAEGDKVTLSTDTLLAAAYTRYDARGRLQGHRTEGHAETLELASANDVSLHIDGNLNDAERADIQQLEFSQSLAVNQQTETRVVAAAPEAQPNITPPPKDLLSAILNAIETARTDVAQSQAPGGASHAL
jgi:hypothetical protein